MQSQKITHFDPEAFLSQSGVGRRMVEIGKKQNIFSQGSRADAVFYIQTGKVKLTVVSGRGKEATLALLGPGDFSGDDWHHSLQGELLHEPFSQARLH